MQMISLCYVSATCHVCRSLPQGLWVPNPTKRKGEIMNNSQCVKLAAGLTAIGMSLVTYWRLGGEPSGSSEPELHTVHWIGSQGVI